MVWYGVVWYVVVWCGVVCCGVRCCGVLWCGVAWCGVVWRGVARHGIAWWCGVVWCGVVWCGMVWYGIGMVFYPTQFGISQSEVLVHFGDISISFGLTMGVSAPLRLAKMRLAKTQSMARLNSSDMPPKCTKMLRLGMSIGSHRITMYCIALHCITLHCIALHFTGKYCSGIPANILLVFRARDGVMTSRRFVNPLGLLVTPKLKMLRGVGSITIIKIYCT